MRHLRCGIDRHNRENNWRKLGQEQPKKATLAVFGGAKLLMQT